MKKNKQQKEPIEYEIGSDNVFADLGFENPAEDRLKSDLVAEIAYLIKKKKLTQTQAAKILKVAQSRISSLISGQLDLFSIEMLMRFINDLGKDIEIVIKSRSRSRRKIVPMKGIASNSTRGTTALVAKSH